MLDGFNISMIQTANTIVICFNTTNKELGNFILPLLKASKEKTLMKNQGKSMLQ